MIRASLVLVPFERDAEDLLRESIAIDASGLEAEAHLVRMLAGLCELLLAWFAETASTSGHVLAAKLGLQRPHQALKARLDDRVAETQPMVIRIPSSV